MANAAAGTVANAVANSTINASIALIKWPLKALFSVTIAYGLWPPRFELTRAQDVETLLLPMLLLLFGLPLKTLPTVDIVIRSYNEFNALYYWRRDFHGMKLRRELGLSSLHSLILKKGLMTVDFTLNKILKFLNIMYRMHSVLAGPKRSV